MKKGESIRLEIRGVSSAGLQLYSYKKKAEIFVDATQLKAGFSKEKYEGLIGTPIIMRLTMTRPEIRVSQKFIHEDAPIFDDYALRPEEKTPVKEPTVQDKKPKSMIENKEIIITKENQFDKGWTLFHPYDLGISNNRAYKETMLSDIVRLVTHATEVNLILTEPCLSSRLIKEIEWANRYITLNVIVKDESILSRYPSFRFSSKVVDKSIDFNYIGIHGKESGFYIINDGYSQINDSVDLVYFRNRVSKRDYSFLGSVETVIIVDKEGKKDYSELISETKKAGVKCYYAVNTGYYDRKHFDFAKREGLTLLVSDYTTDGVILAHKNRTLSCLIVGKKDLFIIHPIEKVFGMLGAAYKCGFYEDTIDTKSLQDGLYSCYKGIISKLNIAEKKVVEIDVRVPEMVDFVAAAFDSSITEKHNDYSAKAIKVEYHFTLIPPLFDETYKESAIYEPLHTLSKQWKSLQKLNIEKIKADYHSFIEEDFGLIDFLNSSITFTEMLLKSVKDCSYKGYYTWVKATADLYRYYDEELIEVCKKIFGAINTESSGTKFSKFDDEIAGYEQTIREKTALIEKGIDVLSNKRRVEILTKKIADLQALKQHFESSSDSRNDKNLSAFIAHCNELLSNTHRGGTSDSIGTIVKPKEETKIARLDAFIDAYLYPIKKYIGDCLGVLGKLMLVHITENYPVYDKDSNRYIIICDLKEFDQTKSLCAEFGLKCVTRR